MTQDYPPTLVATPEYCPLRDEGIAYARRLLESRIPCEHIAYPGLVHAFLNLEDLVPDICADLYCRIGAFLAGTLGTADGS
jgi:acetyl esterase/lipase